MHGRVKVRTSEEEKARKERERQEKLKIFKHAMQKIQTKRKDGELDQELLDITGKVLSSNPDIYTLWNIRREILSFFKKTEDKLEELPKIFDAELQLTEYCLKINPKSYCAWHQREWVLTTRADPDWKKELSLCNTYLKLDERNFHTWDYRRFVVSQCKPPLKDEFDYTTEKLHDNFSNYSAWHYRSKMLVALYPDLEGGRPIEDSHHKHELKLVQNAAFTDPDDTSAWFYQRWLLGAVKKSIQFVVCTVTNSKATVAFNEYVDQEYVQTKLQILINEVPLAGQWISCSRTLNDVLWILNHDVEITDDVNVKIEYKDDNEDKKVVLCEKQAASQTFIGKNNITFQNDYSDPVVDELNKQLDSCRQLLALEPDSKWTLLTTTIFLHCIDPKLYHKEVIANLHSLKSIDKLRAGYYDDMITKWSMELQLPEDYSKNSLKFKPLFDEGATCLPHLQYYSHCEDVDLSNQNLTSKVLPSLVMLQHCKRLSLENNKLSTLQRFRDVPHLEELNLKGNVDLKIDEVEKLKKKSKFNIIF